MYEMIILRNLGPGYVIIELPKNHGIEEAKQMLKNTNRELFYRIKG